MKYINILVAGICLATASCHSNKIIADKSVNKNWVSLFNGKDLQHWTPKITGFKAGENFGNTFRVENGILSTRYNAYDSFRSRFGALYYDKPFANFRLKVEYRFVGELTPGAPSWGYKDGGIQYYCQSPQSLDIDQNFPVCLEFNLHGGNGREENPTGDICASGMYVEIDGKRNTSYCTPPSIKRTFAGEEWVTAEIDVRDGKITHYVNGEAVIHFENPKYDSTKPQAKKLIIAGNDLVKSGYISLQSNSHPMDFRKIEIMEY